MRIAIMGSGGVGGYAGAWLQQAGLDVTFIARGAHLEAMRRDGLRIEHPDLPLHLPRVSATDAASSGGPVDLVIFAVKLFVADGAKGDAVMAELAQAAAGLDGLTVTLSDEATRTVWEKFITLASVSGATSLLRASMGTILAHPETRAFQRQLIEEVIAVAQAHGVGVKAGLADEIMNRLAAMPPLFRSSMAEDLERGNRLELRWLSGRVHGLGIELGVPTPGHTAVYRGLVLHEGGRVG